MWVEDMTRIIATQRGKQCRALLFAYRTGFDVDAIAGYDFGVIRLEGEVGYKHAGIDGVFCSIARSRAAIVGHTSRQAVVPP